MNNRRVRILLAAGAVVPLMLWAWLALTPPPPLLDDVPFACEVLDRRGALLRMGLARDDKYRIRIPLEAVAPEAVRALLLYEDRYFYSHPGVNPLALLRAAGGWLGGGRRTGASTITMQVARLRLHLPAGTWAGKLRQIWAALHMERHYSKRQILEAYFNLAPYGGNVEGIEAAARLYFHTSAFRLTAQEAVALTVIPQNPVRRHPLHGPQFSQARALLSALWRQEEQGEGLEEAQADAAYSSAQAHTQHSTAEAARHAAAAQQQPPAHATPMTPHRPHGLLPLRVFSPADLPFEAPHAAAELLAEQRGSSIIHSTLSLPEQHLLEGMLRRFAARGKNYGLHNAAALLIHVPSMEIRALAGSADFHNTSIAGQVDGTRARRSPGSTLKPFVYALALDQGLIHPMTLLIDSPRSFNGYDPENFDKGFRGPLPAREALQASRNLPAIALAQQLHDPDLYTFLQRAGVALPQPAEHYGLSLVLGGAEVTMREVGTLYAMLWNEGLLRPLTLTHWTPQATLQEGQETSSAAESRATPAPPQKQDNTLPDADGATPLPRGQEANHAPLSASAASTPPPPLPQTENVPAPPARLLSPEAAYITLTMLERGRDNISSGGRILPLRFKTGTSNGFRDAWTAGLLGEYVLVVWAGNFDNSPNPLLVGAETALPLFTDMARALGRLLPLHDLPASRRDHLNIRSLPVCTATGDTDVSLCPDVSETLFIPGVSPVRGTRIFREIWVDTASGLRACQPEEGRTERRVQEFWPSDLIRMFQQAGIRKLPPPDWLPQCRPDNADMAGQPPRIQVPKAGVVYHVQLSAPERSRIPLTASAAPDAKRIYWFAGDRLLGAAAPDSPLLWTPPAGIVELRAVDDMGRTARQKLDVRAAR